MTDTSKYTNEEMKQMFLEQQRKRDALCFTTSGIQENKIGKRKAWLNRDMETLLNDKVNLYKYVKKGMVTQILIVYQIIDLIDDKKHNIKRSEKVAYNDCKSNDLSTYPLMTKEEYKQFVTGSEETALKVLCKKTIDGITALKKYEKKLNFDWQGLNAELTELFKKEMNYLT